MGNIYLLYMLCIFFLHQILWKFEIYIYTHTPLFRNDLANIVRRRGYKFVGELLAKSTKTDSVDFIAEEGLPGQYAFLFVIMDSHILIILLLLILLYNLKGQGEKVDNEVEDVLLSVEEPSIRNYFGSTNTDSNLNSD